MVAFAALVFLISVVCAFCSVAMSCTGKHVQAIYLMVVAIFFLMMVKQ